MHHSTIENLKKISARDIELGTDENTGWHSQVIIYIYICSTKEVHIYILEGWITE